MTVATQTSMTSYEPRCGPSPGAPLYTKREVATALKVSLGTIDKLIRTGRLRVVKIGAVVRVSREDVHRLLVVEVKGG
jgi:excisionase family DNA binding protein